MSSRTSDEVRDSVRDAYAKIATRQSSGCCGGTAPSAGKADDEKSVRLGYTKEDLASVPEGSNLGLGCGNPRAIAALGKGETVLDLGSGGGLDCFLAARQVGESGRVIGVDMTPEMISKARENARAAGFANVEFRLGEIEHLPVADASVDVILSNCVINLSPDKPAVYRDAFRVLKPGGRLAISDMVATADLPPEVLDDPALHSKCVAGAARVEQLESLLASAGFEKIRISPKDESREFVREWSPDLDASDFVLSASIEAVKPAGA
ncbi:MAG TPA: arsenite methyltransferase [Candidatus Saccharimonadales bacterium]|nr:arsenite methyltransferase [Candidatus Saccharimonadales bacterium]